MNYTITPLKMQEPFPGFLSGGCKIAGPEFGQFAEKKVSARAKTFPLLFTGGANIYTLKSPASSTNWLPVA